MCSNPRILWLNLSGSFVTGLDLECPIDAVACLDDGQDFDLIQHRSDVVFLSKERQSRRRVVAHDEATDSVLTSLGGAIQKTLDSGPRASWLLGCPRPSPALENFSCETGYAVVSPSAKLCRWLNHKANFFAGRREMGLPAPRGRWLAPSSIAYRELRNEFGTLFVLQAPRGTTGSGTAIIGSAEDLAEARGRLPVDEEIWCSPYLGHLSLNINALATPAETVVSYPSVQLEGPLFQSIHRGMYCGNDFSATQALEKTLVEDACEQTRVLGFWLASLGYRGLFGVDYVADEATGRLVAIDLNPRWQGSTLLETMASRLDERLPLAAADLLHGAGLLSDKEIRDRSDAFRLPLSGSQLVLYGLHREPLCVAQEVRAGIYRQGESLTFERDALELTDCGDEGELLLGSAVVRPGTTIEPGARPARLFSRRASIDATAGTALQWVAPAVGGVLKLFGLPSD